ncbi:uncharacterized protein LOC132698957 [Cylas formicarius]|uniref:uncharacterized protein LOC132698957 n=1 Tax=Cylas formicarius TaxID=197179 RepID=UPI002958975E|nr:uncharacterized protein LOC132698957 [Cylas formicarius]
MNKDKKAECKKKLVRNSEQPLPKITPVVSKTSLQTSNDSGKNEKSLVHNLSKSDFDKPEPCSTLHFSKKIEAVVKPRKTKSLSEADRLKLAVDEKITRRVNFPLDQPVYKDLIPLGSQQPKSQSVLPARAPLPAKDKEPLLSDFIEPKKVRNYCHTLNVKLPLSDSIVSVPPSHNLRLYKILQVNNEIVL